MVLMISRKTIVRSLTRIALVLSSLGIAAEVVRGSVQSSSHHGLAVLAGKFVLNGELTVPAWYSSALLLVCAAVLGLIAKIQYQARSLFARHWLGLAAIFLLLSIDELAAFHEMLITPMQRYFGAHGIFHYGWVIPANIFVTVFVLSYWRFMFTHLDLRTRSRFIIAGLIYVGAALGMEMLEGPIDEHFGTNALPGITAEFVEETLEMLGVILFLNALLQYLATHVDEVRICFENRAAERSASLSHDSTSPLPEPTSSEAAFWEEEMSDLVLIANKRGRESSSDRRC